VTAPRIPWLAAALLGLAAWIMPRDRAEWISAMRCEIAHLPAADAIAWAMGCVGSALKESFMLRTGSLAVSRWVFLFEMLCFIPLTIGWWDAVAGQSGVIRLNGEIVSKYFLDSVQGQFILAMMIASAVVGVIGPVGLMLAGRFIITGRALRAQVPGFLMIGALLITGVAWVVARVTWGDGAYAASFTSMLLLVLLPAAVIWHLMQVGTPPKAMPAST
jgi:hypothetical protein